MGRSGGGFGGSGGFGGFGGGFGSGGGHFSGGFGGGSHSGGGRSGGPFGGGSFGGYGGGYHGGGSGDFIGGLLLGNLLGNSNNSGGSGGGYRGGSHNNNGGVGNGGNGAPYVPKPDKPDPYKRTKISIVIVLVLLLFTAFAGCSSYLGDAIEASDAPQITHVREALEVPNASTSYFEDRDGDWIYDPRTLNNALRYFEAETGVTPYLVILPNGQVTSIDKLTEIADEIYYDKFSDERHMVLVFCDDGNGAYKCGYSVGSAAASVTDEEAVQVLSRYLDRYYNDYSITETEIFANTYMKTADTIMAVPEERVEADFGKSMSGCVVVIVVGGIVVAALAILDSKRERRRKQDERMKEILSTPLEKFGDDEVENLAKKYEDTGA